jgi:hypothetical protein
MLVPVMMLQPPPEKVVVGRLAAGMVIYRCDPPVAAVIKPPTAIA